MQKHAYMYAKRGGLSCFSFVSWQCDIAIVSLKLFYMVQNVGKCPVTFHASDTKGRKMLRYEHKDISEIIGQNGYKEHFINSQTSCSRMQSVFFMLTEKRIRLWLCFPLPITDPNIFQVVSIEAEGGSGTSKLEAGPSFSDGECWYKLRRRSPVSWHSWEGDKRKLFHCAYGMWFHPYL